jgi:cytochrome c biogenesis protein CcdA
LGVIIGFVLSFTFFTLFLATIVRQTGIPADTLRLTSVIIVALFGISLLIPQFQIQIEQLFSKLSNYLPQGNQYHGFGGGVLIGGSLGLLWTPCVGPILASVISLAIAGTVTLEAALITLSYSLGTGIPMFFIMLGGRKLVQRIPNPQNIQKVFGVIMIMTALGILLNIDRAFQTFILETFPNYASELTQLESIEMIQERLDSLNH